jgi:hypothetical protein
MVFMALRPAPAQSAVPLSDRGRFHGYRRKAALVHLVSRKGLHRLADARGKEAEQGNCGLFKPADFPLAGSSFAGPP